MTETALMGLAGRWVDEVVVACQGTRPETTTPGSWFRLVIE